MKPDMEVETVTRLTRETKVVLSNIAISDILFFKLLSRTAVEIRSKISLVGHDDSLGCCLEGFGERTTEQARICFDGYTSQEMKQVYENIKTIPRKSIQIDAKEVHAKGDGICVLLELLDFADGHIPDLSLETSRKKYIEEITEKESNLGWIGKVKKLSLIGSAVEALPRLKLHQENKMEELVLETYIPGYIAEILRMENNSIWVGKVRKLFLKQKAIQILHKLKFHDENEMEEFGLDSYTTGNIAEILQMENNSVWIGKVKVLKLKRHTIQILPKLRIHGENELKEFDLSASNPKNITEILKEENNSVWMGKVKTLKLGGYAIQILPKLRIHGENEVEELELYAQQKEIVAEILRIESSSIWVGKVKRLVLRGYGVGILPKLKLHQENMMELFLLNAQIPENITEILKEENKSIWAGKVKRLELKHLAVKILPKLKLHGENEMEELVLDAYRSEHITEMLEMENKSIRVGKVRKISLEGYYAEEIFSKLDFTEIAPDGQEENGGV
ncbi:MAG: uncharacterized protein A8A55_2428 [Amphiamblys sp. WSBS2006]|nr:MAG: uncharacterized protein A8A55_2428 [Amphiamblys sp. WSBS2006]